ncbi:DUF1190 domain-containing protein [Erythrobacter sp. GH1-10]|uniref:DUF1190 domain-containing protein n=1 Tax=Erythrobacter sp. GH1-10 TaxID=3349334 RepID=UPI003877A776
MVALGGGAMLSACGGGGAPSANAKDSDKTEVQVFENAFVCAKVTGKSREECDEMRDEAIARAEQEAPRFEALQDCESEYGAGQCVENGVGEEQAQSGRRHYSPFVVAWFSSKGNSSAPLFKSKAGGYQTANGARLGYAGAPGKYFASNRAMERVKSVPKVKAASKLAKAGGFGTRNGSWSLASRDGASTTSNSSTSGKNGSRSKGG